MTTIHPDSYAGLMARLSKIREEIDTETMSDCPDLDYILTLEALRERLANAARRAADLEGK